MELSDLNGIRLQTARKDSCPNVSNSERAHILMVDEPHGRLTTYESVLRGLAVHCTRASTAEQSRAFLQEQEFAAVLVDAQAIKAGNLETLQWMRGHPRYRETPVLFFGTAN